MCECSAEREVYSRQEAYVNSRPNIRQAFCENQELHSQAEHADCAVEDAKVSPRRMIADYECLFCCLLVVALKLSKRLR